MVGCGATFFSMGTNSSGGDDFYKPDFTVPWWYLPTEHTKKGYQNFLRCCIDQNMEKNIKPLFFKHHVCNIINKRSITNVKVKGQNYANSKRK